MASPRKDDAWQPYPDVRFVLIKRPGRTMKPYRGLVVDEKVHTDGRRHLLVTFWVDDGHPGPHLRTDWVPRSSCWPIHVDPNDLGHDTRPTHG